MAGTPRSITLLPLSMPHERRDAGLILAAGGGGSH